MLDCGTEDDLDDPRIQAEVEAAVLEFLATDADVREATDAEEREPAAA
jgi:hypothetical protein